jgi:hypothetical protein
MVGFFCAHLSEIRSIWKNFGQLGRYSTKIGGGNSTARVQSFLNEFRPKKITVKSRNTLDIKKYVKIAPRLRSGGGKSEGEALKNSKIQVYFE